MVDNDKNGVYDEVDNDTSGPAEGSVDPNAPLDEELYEESQSDAGDGPKPGSVDPNAPSDDMGGLEGSDDSDGDDGDDGDDGAN